MSVAFELHRFNRELTNLSLYKYRDLQGYLVTGQHSGTQWIKWMLSHALAAEYGVEPPEYYNNSSSNAVIGHPRHRRPADWPAPRIASSHTIPGYAVDWAWLRAIAPLPPYGVVVRDIRSVLVSNYEKWKAQYGVSFVEYVKGDPRGKAYVCDAWWCLRFVNRWGAVRERYPDQTLALRYEDFRADPRENMVRLLAHFGVTLSDASIDAGIRVGTKDHMALRQRPGDPIVGVRPDSDDQHWDAEATAILRDILRGRLKHDFGYDYGIG